MTMYEETMFQILIDELSELTIAVANLRTSLKKDMYELNSLSLHTIEMFKLCKNKEAKMIHEFLINDTCIFIKNAYEMTLDILKSHIKYAKEDIEALEKCEEFKRLWIKYSA